MNQQPDCRIGPGDTLAFVGDSITWEPGGYVHTIREVLAHRFPEGPPKVINAGTGGDTVRQMLTRFERDALAAGPDWISIMAGVADTVWQMADRDDTRPEAQGSEPAQFAEAVEQMVQQAEDAGVQIAVCTPTRFEENFSGDVAEANSIIEQKTQELERISEDHDLLLIPTGAVLHRARQDAQAAGQELHFTPDGCHPDSSGHSLMALAVLAAFGYDLDPGLI